MWKVKMALFYGFCYTIAFPSQIIYGAKLANDISVEELEELTREDYRKMIRRWYDETILGRTAHKILNWALD